MNELYAEVSVKRKPTLKTFLIKAALIGIAVIALLFTTVSQLLIMVAAMMIMLIVYLFPRLNVEYEYIFCDGQLDFDKIMGNAKRKTMLKIDLEQIEIVAPSGSHALDSYKNSNKKTKNFSSLGQGAKPYVIIGRVKTELVQIIFEPSEKMLQCMKLKAPRKIVKD